MKAPTSSKASGDPGIVYVEELSSSGKCAPCCLRILFIPLRKVPVMPERMLAR